MNKIKSRGPVVIAVMVATIMEVLDMTIINIALPNMGGQLGATPSQMSWALTSYIVASAIAMPLTGFFSDTLGRKRYLMFAMIGFIISSVLCGLATSLPAIVAFRLLQGLSGAALVPMSQAVMIDLYPPKERVKAMAIWAMGIMVAPIMGPVIGGWLTANLSWRWSFFINLPVGLLALWLTWRYMDETNIKHREMDWLGFLAMFIAVGSLQYILDKGNEEDWLDSSTIRWMFAGAIFGFTWLVIHVIRKKSHPIFSPGMFKDRNFLLSSIAMVAVSMALFGSITLQPLYFEQVLGYDTTLAGLYMIPRGIASMFSMMLVSQLVDKVDARYLIGFGAFVGAIGSWGMTMYSLEASSFYLIWPTLFQGLGMGFIFIPLNGIAYVTLPKDLMTEVSGVYSLIRTIGNAIGISIVMLLYTRGIQQSWNHLIEHITPYGNVVNQYLAPLHLDKNSPEALNLIAQQVAHQSQALAMLVALHGTMMSFILIFPFLFFLKKPSLQVSMLDSH
jgi:DHA2 family multidrug resistance protein